MEENSSMTSSGLSLPTLALAETEGEGPRSNSGSDPGVIRELASLLTSPDGKDPGSSSASESEAPWVGGS